MVLGFVITPVGSRTGFLWNDALYSTKPYCDVTRKVTIAKIDSVSGISACVLDFLGRFERICGGCR